MRFSINTIPKLDIWAYFYYKKVSTLKKSNAFFLLIVTDIIFTLLSYFLALILRFDGFIPELEIYNALSIMAIIVPVFFLFSISFKCYKKVWKFSGYHEIARQAAVSLLTCTVLFLLKIIGLYNISISVIILFGIFIFLLTTATRVSSIFINKTKNGSCFNKNNVTNVLVVGAGKSGALLIKQIKEYNNNDFSVLACVDDDPKKKNKNIFGVKVCGTCNDIKRTVRKNRINLIIIALPTADTKTIRKIYQKCVITDVNVKILKRNSNIEQIMNEEDFEIGSVLKEVCIEDLLFRDRIDSAPKEVKEYLHGKTVLVTGGAGSIGSELCRQALDNKCKKLIIFDISENGLFELNEEFKKKYSEERYELVLGSIRDKDCIDNIFSKYRPKLVFHAAAHKHVPMVELNPFEAVKNNIIGTMNVIDISKKYKVEKFILISTDKAVNPTSVMGASKRVAELIVKVENSPKTEMASVRFGNVLGSQGSVVPLFNKQIAQGGPVTITDPEMVRFFMTIPEAVSLVQTAAAFAKGGETFVLDMGMPIKIYDLACDLIRLSGHQPNEEIDIVYTGLRPGEKLFEELSLDSESIDVTSNSKIFVMRSNEINQIELYRNINSIIEYTKNGQDPDVIHKLIFNTIKEGKGLSKSQEVEFTAESFNY